MKLLLALICVLLLVNPAFGATAVGRFHQLLQTNGIPFDGVSTGSNFTQGTKPPNLRIDFKPEATQAQRDQANGLSNTFDWLDKADPNFDKFMTDVFNDGTISAAARRDVSQMGLWFIAGKKQIAQAVWGLLSGGASAAAIRTHATNNGITVP